MTVKARQVVMRVTGAMLTADTRELTAIYRELKQTPQVANVTIRQTSIESSFSIRILLIVL